MVCLRSAPGRTLRSAAASCNSRRPLQVCRMPPPAPLRFAAVCWHHRRRVWPPPARSPNRRRWRCLPSQRLVWPPDFGGSGARGSDSDPFRRVIPSHLFCGATPAPIRPERLAAVTSPARHAGNGGGQGGGTSSQGGGHFLMFSVGSVRARDCHNFCFHKNRTASLDIKTAFRRIRLATAPRARRPKNSSRRAVPISGRGEIDFIGDSHLRNQSPNKVSAGSQRFAAPPASAPPSTHQERVINLGVVCVSDRNTTARLPSV